MGRLVRRMNHSERRDVSARIIGSISEETKSQPCTLERWMRAVGGRSLMQRRLSPPSHIDRHVMNPAPKCS